MFCVGALFIWLKDVVLRPAPAVIAVGDRDIDLTPVGHLKSISQSPTALDDLANR